MSFCWWCHWGWPQEIYSIYDDALRKLDGDDSPLLYGPAHIVWCDENWDSAQWCLDHFDDPPLSRYTDDDLEIVRTSLAELLLVPDEFKSEPDGFVGYDPQAYPPPKHWRMKHR
jgi:hypothetical protein